MVTFTCNTCGDSVKKPKVENHYRNRCPDCYVLTCMDCGKDFHGDDYMQHNSCISEAEKYQGSLYQPKQNQSKGAAKQATWLDALEAMIVESETKNPHLKKYLQQMAAFANVPRKLPKFKRWCTNSLRLSNPKLAEELFNTIADYHKREKEANANANANANGKKKQEDNKANKDNGTSLKEEHKKGEDKADKKEEEKAGNSSDKQENGQGAEAAKAKKEKQKKSKKSKKKSKDKDKTQEKSAAKQKESAGKADNEQKEDTTATSKTATGSEKTNGASDSSSASATKKDKKKRTKKNKQDRKEKEASEEKESSKPATTDAVNKEAKTKRDKGTSLMRRLDALSEQQDLTPLTDVLKGQGRDAAKRQVDAAGSGDDEDDGGAPSAKRAKEEEKEKATKKKKKSKKAKKKSNKKQL